jgi:hypothetical protein
MRVIIPYRRDLNNGRELRYAIRSMYKYFTPISGVLLIGDRPRWYKGDHLPVKHISHKESDIINKILQCPDEHFLFCMDDNFALQPFDETLPLMYEGPLQGRKEKGKYKTRIDNVLSVYPDGYFYDIHVPHIINRYAYHSSLPDDWRTREYLCKSLYGNFMRGYRLSASHAQVTDYKISSKESLTVDTAQPFFSTIDYLAGKIKFEMLYPEPSPHE